MIPRNGRDRTLTVAIVVKWRCFTQLRHSPIFTIYNRNAARGSVEMTSTCDPPHTRNATSFSPKKSGGLLIEVDSRALSYGYFCWYHSFLLIRGFEYAQHQSLVKVAATVIPVARQIFLRKDCVALPGPDFLPSFRTLKIGREIYIYSDCTAELKLVGVTFVLKYQ